jgi:hypothetical protein
MNKTFCRMDHDSTTKLELIQVIKDFCTVETAVSSSAFYWHSKDKIVALHTAP